MAAFNRLILLTALAPLLAAQPLPFGAPECPAGDHELALRTYFTLCHSASRKQPVWVGYQLTADHLNAVAPRPKHFRRDAALAHPGASDSDYRHSGYSRGHMAPAADFAWSAEAIRTTFLLSNAVPQRQNINAGLWAQLERAVRRIAAVSDAVLVYSGPIFAAESPVIGSGRVAVPSHFFKVFLVQRQQHRSMYAAIIPNSESIAEPLGHFVASVDDVEQRAGLDFFAALDDDQERSLESARLPIP